MNSVSILGPSSPSPPVPQAQRFDAPPAELRHAAGGAQALYLHIPFCTTKCDYCDFYSLPGRLERADAYLEALSREAAMHRDFFGKPRPRTIFIGGGTPTLLSARQWEWLFAILGGAVDFSVLEEFTVEANPNTFDREKARVLAAGGVNRMSFGAQSFDSAELRTLQRDHDPQSVAAAMACARAAGIENLNIDLIFGIPGQTLDSWATSLDRALELAPAHLSCYSLTYETGTGMTARLRRGEIEKINEGTELAMFEHVYQRLGEAGFFRYETSNYARRAAAGARVCRHNLLYWKAANWLGWGTSAGNHFALPERLGDAAIAWQWKNVGSLGHYLEALGSADPQIPMTQLEILPRGKWAAAAAVFWLRLSEGLNFAEFQARTGVDTRAVLGRSLAPFVEMGLAESTPENVRITEKGVAVSNHMLSRVLGAMESAA